MIKISDVETCGIRPAIRGMRNPMNSWEKSDSVFDEYGGVVVGDSDLNLMKSLSSAGNDHAKFLRMIIVWLDITAPLYWWKEFDTYKVGTVANSCSTMHKIHAKEFATEDFSTDRLSELGVDVVNAIIEVLNVRRKEFLVTKDKSMWDDMIQILPTSYNQKRTVQLNYQVLKSMYHARKNHKLQEWRDFCAWCETLPYFKEICK
ncbi:MAG: hypothetical protein J6S14_11640 [Clostridia bacterium]|nr:hypothetical protein [Clostridia bacterium]